MSRKRCHRRVTVPMPPRGLRPKMTAGQVLDLGLIHHMTLDDIQHGRADEERLWQWVGGMLTWSRVCQLRFGLLAEEIEPAMHATTAMVARYRRTGRIVCTGPELQALRVGVGAMDELAETTDHITAIQAANWSEEQTNALKRMQLREEAAGETVGGGVMSVRHVVLVGCCAEKLSIVAPARRMYRSQLFLKAMDWAERNAEEWRVISAAHGLIKPDEQLAPYDLAVRDLSAERRDKWARRVARSLDLMADGGVLRVTLLAGASYAGWVPLVQPWCAVEQPLAGMSIGHRLQWFSRQSGESPLRKAA